MSCVYAAAESKRRLQALSDPSATPPKEREAMRQRDLQRRARIHAQLG
eukprot:CAMPEP_0181182370 /NCGR_PEP_ID=MMETSP1096-20121128/7855_1 /TAXON_ID=156174 ORGANISM="Chrysochromulina ericina, Strain CCMP281" /NCGR_SAMPLE_ID=MMETSP1096 /ASSEMBLY_ACC=CAM_ASM_000453 /LENGTH=47 /DNA_ID= /DNA_START= /DNA_END= /DNA_ORIENTATION=